MADSHNFLIENKNCVVWQLSKWEPQIINIMLADKLLKLENNCIQEATCNVFQGYGSPLNGFMCSGWAMQW